MKKIAIVALLSSLTVAPAIAADIYVGAQVAQNQTGYSATSSSTGFAVLGGYSFSDSLAAELSYGTSGEATTTVTGVPAGVKTTGSKTALVAVYTLPVGKDFSVKGKLGYASTSITSTCAAPCTGSSGSRSDLAYGIGGQYNVNKAIGVTVGYDVAGVGDGTNFTKKDLTSIYVGMVYKM